VANIALHAAFRQLRSGQLRILGFTAKRVLAVLAFTHAGPHRDNRVRRSLASRAQARAAASINVGALILTLALTGCTIGPNYSREAAPVPAHFKELKSRSSKAGNAPRRATT
jgi:hypothetical protein